MSWSDIEVMPGISGADYWSFRGSGMATCGFFTECLQLYNNCFLIPAKLKT